MKKQKTNLLRATALAAVFAHSALTAQAGSSPVVYDSDLNVDWTQDANLFHTRANSFGAGASAFVTAVINASGGTISDTPNSLDTVSNSGSYTLSTNDFNTSTGQMTYWGARAWVTYLNSISYAGLTNWTLPQITPVNGSSFNPNLSYNGSTDRGFNSELVNSMASQLAHLYFNELGNLSEYNSSGSKLSSGYGLLNSGSFSNFASNAYWFAQDYDGGTLAGTPGNYEWAWLFSVATGAQGFGPKNALYYAEAVAAVPLAAKTVLPNTTANGIVYMTYDRVAWATVAPSADYYTIGGTDTGSNGVSADAIGQRWIFPDLFEGTNWVAASYPSSYLTPLPDYSLVQPYGGFVLPVNTYGSNSFAANHEITTYNSTTTSNGYIGLGGSFRATSDFNEPGASVWWEHLALMQDPSDNIWKLYATTGPGEGSIFELRNVTVETIKGNLRLSGDYVFGNTDWSQFLNGYNGIIDTNRILGHIDLIPAGVAKVFAGKAVINYNQTAWESLASGFATPPVLTLSGFFDQAQANVLNQGQLLTNVQASYSYSNQIYAMNGPTVSNLPTRYTQPTTFAYPRGSLTNETGSVGLGGVARFAVLGGAAGSLLYGDYTLQYDTSRLALGGSGWYLYDNIPPAAAAFDLINVSVTETTNLFTISADLGVSFEVANFLYYTPGDTLADVGTFTFTGYTVPFTTPAINSLTVTGGNATLQAANGLAGSGFTVLSTTNLNMPVASWDVSGTGNFAGDGTTTNSIPVNSGEPARFYQLQQP